MYKTIFVYFNDKFIKKYITDTTYIRILVFTKKISYVISLITFRAKKSFYSVKPSLHSRDM